MKDVIQFWLTGLLLLLLPMCAGWQVSLGNYGLAVWFVMTPLTLMWLALITLLQKIYHAQVVQVCSKHQEYLMKD